MTSIENLFSNFNDLLKPKSVIDNASECKTDIKKKEHSPGLMQGVKFKKYQNAISNNLEKKIKKSNLVEGFEGLELNKNGLTEQTNHLLNKNDFSSQQQTITNLKSEYQNTLTEYQTLMTTINGNITNYVDRVNPKNPYLDKNVCLSGGECGYVTKQGVFKLYPKADNNSIYNNTAGKNGCPKTPYVTVNGSGDVNSVGSSISTTPSLIVGTPMESGQSCGNEGVNVFVNNLLDNPNVKYEGCYADNVSSPLMDFIGGSPPEETTLQNGNFAESEIANNSYKYLSWDTSTVPGWNFNCVLINNSTAWGIPMPYPAGNQCAVIQGIQQLWSGWLNLTTGVTYTLTFSACGRNCCDGSGLANPIDIGIDGENTFYTATPSLTWANYSTTFTVQTTGNHRLSFIGTWTAGDRSTAIQNIQLNSSGASGTYTYDSCKEAAINSGYQYFSLQGVNPTNSQGYCGVSNSQPTATSLGNGIITSSRVLLWSSSNEANTSDDTGYTATVTNTGSLSILDSTGVSVFATDSSAATPSNYLGCYQDCTNGRGLPTEISGWNTYETCQDAATQGNWSYFGLQNTQPNGSGKCWVGNDITQGMSMGKATNCTTANNAPSGGGCSNAIFNNSETTSNYFLTLKNNGNMCLYRGTSPKDNQGKIWCSNTKGKQKSANSKFSAVNGKYGQNWIANGSTLAAGDFVGSKDGSIALIMNANGKLGLYTFGTSENCQKMSDGNTGGGVGANALYNIGKVGYPENINNLAYIDSDSKLHSYPASNTQYSQKYTKIAGYQSSGNDIANASYGNATVQSCETTCNNNEDCAGFSFINDVCYPKNSGMYPNGEKQVNSQSDLYIRGKTPITTPTGVSSKVNNIDSILYQNYTDGGELDNSYGLANATTSQKTQLSALQDKLNLLTSQINGYTDKFSSGTNSLNNQSNKNMEGLGEYLKDFKKTNNNIKNINTGTVENILNDSDITVLQKNYEYLFWSILAAGTVLITMNMSGRNS